MPLTNMDNAPGHHHKLSFQMQLQENKANFSFSPEAVEEQQLREKTILDAHLLPRSVGTVDQTYLRGGNYMIAEREAMFREDFTQIISKTSNLNPGKPLTLDIPLPQVAPQPEQQ